MSDMYAAHLSICTLQNLVYVKHYNIYMILGSTTDRVQPKTIHLVFVASPLSIKEKFFTDMILECQICMQPTSVYAVMFYTDRILECQICI
jgi:hypothetical protein